MPQLTPENRKMYSVHDHWTDINKKNDVDIISIDGEITRIKVNGEDYGGGGGSSDLTWILPEQTVTLVDQPVEITGLRLDLIPQHTFVMPIKIELEIDGHLQVIYIVLRYLNGALNDDEGLVSIYSQDNSYYFVYTDGENIQSGEYTISIALF